MTRFLLFCLLAVFLLDCGSVGDRCPRYGFYNQFSYQVRPAIQTASGISVDRTGQEVSLDRIDQLTREVETCLAKNFGDPPRLPPDVRQKADCLVETFDLPFKRECLVVKIPDDWTLSCTGYQVLPAPAPEERCREKGLEPTSACPCRYRAGIQDDHFIVTTPNLFLYKDPLVRLMTSCNNPWAHPSLATCM